MRKCDHDPALVYASGNCCFACEDYLLPAIEERGEVSNIVQFVHNQFRAFVLDTRFPCAGAKAAMHQNSYRFGLYPEIGSAWTTATLEKDIRNFCADYIGKQGSTFATFIASFIHPTLLDERAFEEVVWSQLQFLHDSDKVEWDPEVSSDPENSSFAFSFAGYAFFVVGLHAASSRWSRRFAWPTLIFNAHHQFTQLRNQGKFERFQQIVRGKDQDLQGTLNPNLRAYAGLSAARQYSGRFVEREWGCPFHFHKRNHSLGA